MDFSMLDLNTDGAFSYQPQVFSVLSLPEATIDTELLSGKSSNSFTALPSDDEKVEIPAIERVPEAAPEEAPAKAVEVVDEEFDSDPIFALYASPAPSTAATVSEPESEPQDFSFDFSTIDITSKPSHYELIVSDGSCMRKVDRLAAEMDAAVERLEKLTMNF